MAEACMLLKKVSDVCMCVPEGKHTAARVPPRKWQRATGGIASGGCIDSCNTVR